jgi:hypothetical protein
MSSTQFPIWTTQNGDQISVDKMTNSHLRNSREMCFRQGAKYHREAMAAMSYPGQGDMAQYYADRAGEELQERAAWYDQWVGSFDKEIKRRQRKP